MNNEVDHIKERYDKRKSQVSVKEEVYSRFVINERNALYKKQISRIFVGKGNIEFLEVGAGSGMNIGFFKNLGIKPDHITANELLLDRVEELKKNHPDIHIFPGNVLDMPDGKKYDIVFQSTVFTSILDDSFRVKVAQKMWDLLTPGGIILWYDFMYNNPRNKDVKKVTIQELKALFPKGDFIYGKKLTLAPPIGRRVGRLYSIFNSVPFLRSHYVAVIQKK